MMMLLSFDLPRDTKEERKQASEYRKRLVELGFSMKQYSLYERLITLYLLPDEVNNKQITILGKDAPKITVGAPHLIVL